MICIYSIFQLRKAKFIVFILASFLITYNTSAHHFQTKLDSVPDDGIFTTVEEMPRFPGCETIAMSERHKCSERKFLEYIYRTIQYPSLARRNGVKGVVVVRFVIDENGYIQNPHILRDIGAGCGEAVLEVIKSLKTTQWIPGKQFGKSVKVRFNLPIRFRLDESYPTQTLPMLATCKEIKNYDERMNCLNAEVQKVVDKHLIYPEKAEKEGIEGTVWLNFKVKKNGKIKMPKVVQKLGYGCDKEALRMVQYLKELDWVSGAMNGKTQDVHIQVPIVFKLEKKE